jgi:hypothetical protein
VGVDYKEHAKTYLEMLFEPDDIFEVRTKSNAQNGASQFWLKYNKIGQFIDTHLDIHKSHKRHVWIGVGPRDRVGSTNPACNRVLWVDLDASVVTDDRLEKALEDSGLPQPTMVVWSGNGYHLYWKLTQAIESGKIRSYSMGVHDALPSDSTHDPTRVMRVPGSWNFKNEEHPTQCQILTYDPDLVYEPTRFPTVQSSSFGTTDEYRPSSLTLSTEDFDLFLSNWMDGQKHTMAVGVSGYLRKNLMFNKEQTLQTIAALHQEAGYSWPDQNLLKVVEDTYTLPLGKVSGLSKLYELGVVPSVKDAFSVKLLTPKKHKVSVINFNQEIKRQEFWLPGLIGPGMLSIWAAQPKSGKSFAVMQIGHALSQGKPIWGFNVPKAVRVLYFQGELSEGMVAERAISMFGHDSLKNPRQFALTDKPEETISLVQHPEILNDLAENYDLIIVDPLSAFNSNDENSFTSVRETISVFDSLKARGKAVLLVHHTRKLATDREGNVVPPTFNDIRGSSAWFGASDAIAMQYTTPDGNSRVKFTFRAAPEIPQLTLYRQANGGFTSSREEYLAMQSTLKVSLSELN